MFYGDDLFEGFVCGCLFLYKVFGIGFIVFLGYILENLFEVVFVSSGFGIVIWFDGVDVSGYLSLVEYMMLGWINGLLL